MAKQLTALTVFVASPSDVQAERDALEEVVATVNRDTAWPLGLHLNLWRWEVDARPGFHLSGPQGFIEDVSGIADCDVLIGIFWTRLGTPTAGGKTGAEHEFTIALETWRRSGEPALMIYFNQKAHSPSSAEELDQVGRLLSFQKCFPSEGLSWKYDGASVFRELAGQHLRSYLRDFKLRPRFESIKRQQGLASLVLKGIKEEYYRMLDKNMSFCPPVRVNVMVPDSSSAYIRILFADEPDSFGPDEFKKTWERGEGKCGKAWDEGRIVILDPESGVPEHQVVPMKVPAGSTYHDLKSVLSLPLFVENTVCGVLNVDSKLEPGQTRLHEPPIARLMEGLGNHLVFILPKYGIRWDDR
jgi:hypothetical protein